MTQQTRRVLALTLALAVVGIAAFYGANRFGATESSAAAPRAVSPCWKHRLTQRQILRLGRGPLTQRAAHTLVCGPHRTWRGA